MDFEIENEILGNFALNPSLLDKFVVPDDAFLDPTNRFIYKLFKMQYKDSKTIDLTLLLENYKQYFNIKFPVETVVPKITSLITDTLPIESKFDYYQETLFSRYIKNQILIAVKDFQSQKITTDEMLDLIHKYENMSIRLEDNKLSSDEIFNLITSENKDIKFRFKSLSKHANIQEHDLVVIASRPGMGKTGFILNLLEDISDSYNCILFNMEMSEKQVYQRLAGINTKIKMQYQTDLQTEYQKEKLKEGCINISKKKIKVISSSQTINSIRRKIINESKNEHTIVFIDYVGLIIGRKNQTPYERVTEIVKELRQISLDYDCTIFLVSQINRNSVNSSDKKGKSQIPKIQDLKESGELEQSATTVLMLHDENYGKNLSRPEIEIQVVIGKNRNGKVGIVPLVYDKENQRYSDPKKQIAEPNSWRKE